MSAWSKRQKGPVYVEKICPGKEGHPPSRLSFNEPYMGKMLTPPSLPPSPPATYARVNSTRTCSDCFA